MAKFAQKYLKVTNVTLKSNSMLGSGSIILQGLTIEEKVLIGAGAVLTRNTVSNSLYIGLPAKFKKNID